MLTAGGPVRVGVRSDRPEQLADRKSVTGRWCPRRVRNSQLHSTEQIRGSPVFFSAAPQTASVTNCTCVPSQSRRRQISWGDGHSVGGSKTHAGHFMRRAGLGSICFLSASLLASASHRDATDFRSRLSLRHGNLAAAKSARCLRAAFGRPTSPHPKGATTLLTLTAGINCHP